MSSTNRKTIVIGGGVIGAFCAWFLQQTGRDVTIIDRSEFGAACSHGNCGYVSPSHVLPLPKPGQLAIGLKAMFARNGALKIRPGFNLSLWTWLLKFAGRCNHRDMLQAGAARHALLESSRQLYQQIIESHSLNVEWQTDGLLFVFRNQTEFDHFGQVNDLLTKDFQVAADPIDGKALAQMEPALKPGLAGAWHYRNDAHLRPDRLMSELKRCLQDRGVRIVAQQDVRSFVGQNGQAVAVRTAADEFSADEFVVATGALTPFLNSELGCRIPIQPGKGYSITMSRPALCPKYPMLLEEVHVGITPFHSGYRIGSTMELAGYNSRLSPERLQYLRSGAAEYLLDPFGDQLNEEWFGWRPMTWDGLPYIDRSPRFSNVWVAAGHNMLGLSMGTATGRLLSELMSAQTPHIDPSPFRIGR
ncbi:MAG: FAD-dependent oxidoreductase [Planctomycetaceae bacterium]